MAVQAYMSTWASRRWARADLALHWRVAVTPRETPGITAYPRAWAHRAIRALGRSVLEVFALLLPRRSHSVIYGVPETEGNAVEVARRHLADRDVRLTWLTETGDRAAVAWTLEGVPH